MDGAFKGVTIKRVENGHLVTLKPFEGDSESDFKHLLGGKIYSDDNVENLGDMGGMYYDIGRNPKVSTGVSVSRVQS